MICTAPAALEEEVLAGGISVKIESEGIRQYEIIEIGGEGYLFFEVSNAVDRFLQVFEPSLNRKRSYVWRALSARFRSR